MMAEFFQANLDQLKILGQIVLAMLLGGLIGINREYASKAAGLRTHIFVAGASSLLVCLSDSIVGHFDLEVNSRLIQTDPIRMIEAVVTGVSFLGAGTIIRHAKSQQVEGLTTAASMPLTSVIGVCVAVSQIILAVGATLLALLVLWLDNYKKRWISNDDSASQGASGE